MSISSTTYFNIIDFPHNFPPIGSISLYGSSGSTQLTGDEHLSNTVEYSIPTTVCLNVITSFKIS
jgi:hypothetical protein